MSTHSRWINGALAFYDIYRHRLIDAYGSNVVKCLEHFVNIPLDDATIIPTAWTGTAIGTSPFALVAGSDTGEALLTTGASENDGLQLQLKGEAFSIQAGKPLYFGCRFKINDATQSDFLIGLCITDTTLLGGVSDGLFFRKVDGTTAVYFVLGKDAETSTAAFTCDTSYHIVEFFYDGSHIDWYVDGVKGTRPVETYLTDDEYLTPSIAVLTGEGNACALTVDWIRAIQFM